MKSLAKTETDKDKLLYKLTQDRKSEMVHLQNKLNMSYFHLVYFKDAWNYSFDKHPIGLFHLAWFDNL